MNKPTRRKRFNLIGDDGDAATCEFVGDGDDLFLVFNGERIAKRGQPNTPQARTWVNLIPGYSVIDDPDRGGLTVTSNVCE
jgi:hypothetical protein